MSKRKKEKWFNVANLLLPFLGPVLFEIVNSITGDWMTNDGKFVMSNGKYITITIGIVYIVFMIFLITSGNKKQKDIAEIEKSMSEIEKINKVYQKANTTICSLLAYVDEKIQEQIDYFKRTKKIDVRNLNINSAATNICTLIYQSIIEISEPDTKVTVNMYKKHRENNVFYSKMIAHEGYASNPSVLGITRLIKQDKSDRYSDKILISNTPDYRILLTKEEIAKAFKINVNKCKYNQYLGIPVRKNGGINIALIEIVIHGDVSVWGNCDDAEHFAQNYCEVLKEYVLLLDKIFEQGETIAWKIDEEA